MGTVTNRKHWNTGRIWRMKKKIEYTGIFCNFGIVAKGSNSNIRSSHNKIERDINMWSKPKEIL